MRVRSLACVLTAAYGLASAQLTQAQTAAETAQQVEAIDPTPVPSEPATREDALAPSDATSEGDAPALRIAVISDLNERYGDTFHRPEVHAAVRAIQDVRPDVILVTGDMVAGQRQGLDYAGMWTAFHDAVTTPLRSFPFAVTPGNHDASSSSRFAEERRLYREQWTLESLQRGEVEVLDVTDYPLRYTFRVGPVQFISLDSTERSALRSGDQLDWRESQLASVDDSDMPVRVIFGHVPFYPLARDREGSYLLRDGDVRGRVEALFARYDVDLLVGGHHHAYYPGRHPSDEDLRIVGMGCLGGGPRRLIGDERPLETDDPTERSFVLIEIGADGIRSVEAHHGPVFGPSDLVDRETLPRAIEHDDVRVVRDDL